MKKNMKKHVLTVVVACAGFTLSACAAPAQNGAPSASAQQAKAPRQANADVSFVKAVETAPGVWRFDVSVAHPDTSWEDYADGWDVVGADGTVIKPRGGQFTRTLFHPHIGQIPFTRSQSGLKLKGPVVTVRAHDMVDGFGGQEVRVDLRTSKGPHYRVIHQ